MNTNYVEILPVEYKSFAIRLNQNITNEDL